MELGEQLLAVATVLAALVGGLWFLKRKGWAQTSFRRATQAGGPRLELVDRLTLTPQHSVHLIRLGDRTLLLGISPGSCSVLESAPLTNLSRGLQER